MQTAFTNARIVTEEGVVNGAVLVQAEKILRIYENGVQFEGAVIDCHGMYLMPGCIDTHVHFREPAPNEREDFCSGTMSAAAGGITCVVDHPLDVPPVLDGDSYDRKLAAISPKAYVDYGLWGGVTEQNLDTMHQLKERGVLAYKAFLCASDPLFPMIGDGALLKAMQYLAADGAILGLHAENNDILTYNRLHYDAAVPWQSTTHSQMRPIIAEMEAVSRAILFAEFTGVRLHLLHLGIHEGAQLIREAKARGLKVTAETCPHYLTLEEGSFAHSGTHAKCCPPLRDRSHMETLWDYILDGTIDLIVSDHSPYTVQEKAKSPLLAPPGITGVQTGLQVMLSEGCHKRGIPIERLAKLMSTNAAKIFGLYGRKGAIKEGFDADFTLVDFDLDWIIEERDLHYKNKASAFVGFRGKGKPVATFVRGRCVHRDCGVFEQGAGYGKLIKG